jgi:hypothetical protein
MSENVTEVLQNAVFGTNAQKERLVTLLKLHGITSVTAEFAGSGDSGSIDELIFWRHAENISAQTLALPIFWMGDKKREWDAARERWVETAPVEVERTLESVIEQITYTALDRTGLNWCNDEGGQGMLCLDLLTTPPSMQLDVGVNRMETDEIAFELNELEE